MERLKNIAAKIFRKSEEPKVRRDIDGYPLDYFDLRLDQLVTVAKIENMGLDEFFKRAMEIFEEDAKRKEIWLRQQQKQQGGDIVPI